MKSRLLAVTNPRTVRAERCRTDEAAKRHLKHEDFGPFVVASHTFAVLSSLVVTTRVPSGLNDATQIWRVCPLRARTWVPVFASRTLAVLSTRRSRSGFRLD